MALPTRAGTMVAMPFMRKRTLFGFGALAAGLAMVHRTELTGIGMRFSAITPLRPLRFIYRSQSTFSGLFSSITSTSGDGSANMASLTPPQSPPKWTHTAKEILDLTKEQIEKHKVAEDKVAALPPSECSFESVRDPFASIVLTGSDDLGLCDFFRSS